MKKTQNLTPKYWAAHDINTSDIFIGSMFKYKQDSYDYMVSLFGENWEENYPNYKIELIEIRLVGE